MDNIKSNQEKILKLLNSYADDERNEDLESPEVIYNIKFPIDTIEGVDKLEYDCIDVNNAYKIYQYASKFKPLQENMRMCSKYGLSQLFIDSILTKYNWDGKLEKLAFNKLKRLNSILFRAWKSDSIQTFSQYAGNIRHQLYAARTRINKRNNVRKKQNLQLT